MNNAADARPDPSPILQTAFAFWNAKVLLTAVELGLGTHIKTGGVMADPAARTAAGVRDDERIVAVVNVGMPLEVPPPKRRDSAAAFTTWVP
jgi:nitroreductase